MSFPQYIDNCKNYSIKIVRNDNELSIITTLDDSQIIHKQDINSDKDIIILSYSNEEIIYPLFFGNPKTLYENLMIMAVNAGMNLGESLQDINHLVRFIHEREINSK